MKKIISLVLALALVLASCAVAFAADPAYKITVENTNDRISIEGKEYTAYKIFDAVYSGDNVSYTIKSTSPFYSGEAKAALDVYFDFTASANDPTTIVVTVKKDPNTQKEITVDARALADSLLGKLPANNDGTGTGTDEQKAEIAVPSAGYYLVTGSIKSVKDGSRSAVTAIALVPVKDANAKTIPKADIPDLNKKITAVKEGSTTVPDAILDAAGKAAVAKVGSVEEYLLESTAPDVTGYTAYTYTFHDTMSAGLTYNKNAKVYVAGTELDASKYTKTENDSGFVLNIPFNTLKTLTPGDKVEVKYSATVNANALTYDYDNNTAYLEYTPGPGQNPDKTPDEITYSIDINVDVNKYSTDPADPNGKLTGAKFVLYKVDGEGAAAVTSYYKWADNKVTWVASKDAADVFETENGALKQQIRGLDKGKYFLLETEAPKGFNLLTAPIEFTISVVESADGKTVTYSSNPGTVTGGTIDLSKDHEDQPVDTIDVLNQSGTELPSTGGIGTTIFYILGGLLVVGAAVILVARRKAQD